MDSKLLQIPSLQTRALPTEKTQRRRKVYEGASDINIWTKTKSLPFFINTLGGSRIHNNTLLVISRLDLYQLN